MLDINSLLRGTGTGCPEKLWMPHFEGIQGQCGWGLDLVGGNLDHCRGLKLDDL